MQALFNNIFIMLFLHYFLCFFEELKSHRFSPPLFFWYLRLILFQLQSLSWVISVSRRWATFSFVNFFWFWSNCYFFLNQCLLQGIGNILSNLIQKRIEMRKLNMKVPEQLNLQVLKWLLHFLKSHHLILVFELLLGWRVCWNGKLNNDKLSL